MKCSNCGHLVRTSYEYGEYECEIGVDDMNPDTAKYLTYEGCNMPKKKRIERCKYLKGYDVPLWWDESEEA